MNGEVLKFLIPLVAIVMGSLMFLIPIAGLTARFAVKPILEAIRGARDGSSGAQARELAVLEQRVALLEAQYQGLEGSIERLSEVKDFERRLGVPPRAE